MRIRNKIDTKIPAAGFTLIELIIVVCVMAILFLTAIPAFTSWQQSVKYKQAMDGILSTMRTARHNAVSLNLQNRVECNPAGNRYRITQGDRTYNSSTWATVKQDWVTLPASIVMKTGDCTSSADMNIAFSPNGTASQAGTICINDNASNKYQVVVSASGRIRSLKP